jgi:hypothetical protein
MMRAEPRSNIYERTGLRSASCGYHPDFPIIPSGYSMPYGSSWADRAGAMGDLAFGGLRRAAPLPYAICSSLSESGAG